MENKDKFLEIEEKKDEAGLGNPEELKRTVCVIGHKNPDTDSICAAISYAYLKNSKERGFHYVPVRTSVRRATGIASPTASGRFSCGKTPNMPHSVFA